MNLLKPTANEVDALAFAESQPAEYARFKPLALGAVLTVLSLGLIGLVSIPWVLLRVVVRLVSKRPSHHG